MPEVADPIHQTNTCVSDFHPWMYILLSQSNDPYNIVGSLINFNSILMPMRFKSVTHKLLFCKNKIFSASGLFSIGSTICLLVTRMFSIISSFEGQWEHLCLWPSCGANQDSEGCWGVWQTEKCEGAHESSVPPNRRYLFWSMYLTLLEFNFFPIMY